eukprot:PITA_33934
MLYDQDMPKFLWAEACNITVYVQNKTPHRALAKITPEKVFIGKTPEVSHFRIFGSLAYCHIPKEERRKLDQTVEKGYLVGYSENVKAYKIYLPGSRKVVVRRYVNFMEDRAFRRSREMPFEEQSKEDPLVMPLQPIEVKNSSSENFIEEPRNSKRERKQPYRYQALVAQDGEFANFKEATEHQVYLDAMVKEYNSIMVNNVRKAVSRPQDRSVGVSRWIYKSKYVADGSVEKYKRRFLARGYA